MGLTGGVLQTAQLQVSHVTPDKLDFVWDQVLPMVKRGLRHGAGDTTSAVEIYSFLEAGDMEMWAIHEGPSITAIIVLEIEKRQRGLVLNVVLIAGKSFESWSEQVQKLIEDYASLIGAYTIEAVVRDGMRKWLEPLGWKRKATIMEIKNGR